MKLAPTYLKELNHTARLAAAISEVPGVLICFFEEEAVHVIAGFGVKLPDTLDTGLLVRNYLKDNPLNEFIRDEKNAELFSLFTNSLYTTYNYIALLPFAGSTTNNLGFICLFNTTSQQLNPSQKQSLIILAEYLGSRYENVNYNENLKSGIKRILERRFSKLSYYHNAVLNNTNYGVIFTDINGLIKTFNRGAEAILGFKTTDVVDKLFFPGILDKEEGKSLVCLSSHPPEPDFEKQVRAKILGNREVNNCQVIKRNKEILNIQLALKSITNEKKEVIGYLAVVEDITERIRIEEDLEKARAAAEKSSRAKDQFLANMSHEVRTPMNAIIGFTDVLWKEQLNNEQREYVDAIKSAGNNLLGIINDILDVSKIESGKLTLDAIPFFIKDAILNACALLKIKAREKGLNLKVLIDPFLPDTLLGDQIRLNQILYNLVGNAIKFTPKGEVEVFASLEKETEKVCEIKFIVRDTGIGIPANKLESIFERFTQVSDETTRKYGGTGLGLSISKNLIEMHQGVLNVSSELNKGSVFSFSLTYSKDTVTKPEKKEKMVYEKNTNLKIKILLAEDNELNQKLAQKVIGDFGFELVIAENGKVAVEKLKRDNFNLVLMDLQMPEMDGYQATQQIRNTLMSNVPIIAMTAHSLVGEKDKCIQLGMNDYIAKPFKADDLYYKITQLALKEAQKSEGHRTDSQEETVEFSLERLKELSGGVKEFEKEMLELFIKNCNANLNIIESGIKDQDVPLIKKTAHSFKSSIAIFGLSETERKIAMLENKDLDAGMRSLYEEIKQEIEKIMSKCKDLLYKNYY